MGFDVLRDSKMKRAKVRRRAGSDVIDARMDRRLVLTVGGGVE